MNVELQINSSTNPNARYVTWAPSPCRIRVTNPSGATTPLVTVQLTSSSAATAGAVVFRAGTTGTFSNSLTVQVPISGNALTFFVAGRNGRPSVNDGDVTIEARTGTTLVGSVKLMVRIRKNANNLTAGERDRLVAAFAQLNNQGTGRFADFRDMHTVVSSPQAHGAPGFLPWHRAYLLDLERELQAIDPSVALPYWRFDRPAPNIFTRDFFGVSTRLGTVQFSADESAAVLEDRRRAGDHPASALQHVRRTAGTANEAQTLALGSPGAQYRNFRIMEGNPHGSAHTSFGGLISEYRYGCEGSAFLPPPLQRGPAVGEMAAAVQPLQSGQSPLRMTATPRTHPDTICPTRCGRGTA